ncbi:hypothetical protein ABIE85_007103 [Bradyrhizobium diazoefficiens]|jgi:hypothetical protein|uniref:Uncharacterized protein n=1 Tax=Bradyrhizobium diazoefficiens TaxID=1355477 RepID=A0A809XKR2_9BRAD|nr:hypothetical protein [Bradyrhizobium diazoefficiens]MBP1060187.1 hypothetical protein [Bradyrhizobium japonicum]AWO88231.1 hypothetical protein DI395_06435 [Bradyrhizobium diazoefficiens]WLA57458.1 hypothetical protein QIH81_01545 [Bradyrhizobium diazoefficiens]BCA00289.1 hypothetical protein H12S4_11930 [Bradyrhizobium diazoefficiens]BCA17973.1 hypothetical protein BDHH15_11880 [Bradyrhizobium diazoefficiens]
MSDIFDDLISGSADEGPLGNAVSAALPSVCVLMVPEKAPTGHCMHVEEMVYQRTAGIPQVIFEAVDPDIGEVVFENEPEFRLAMDSLTPVSVDAALAWCRGRIGAVFDAHRVELEEAYFAALESTGPTRRAPGADAVQPRARMPHSTGREGRGRK